MKMVKIRVIVVRVCLFLDIRDRFCNFLLGGWVKMLRFVESGLFDFVSFNFVLLLVKSILNRCVNCLFILLKVDNMCLCFLELRVLIFFCSFVIVFFKFDFFFLIFLSLEISFLDFCLVCRFIVFIFLCLCLSCFNLFLIFLSLGRGLFLCLLCFKRFFGGILRVF